MKKDELKEIIREVMMEVLREEFGQGAGVSTSPEEESVCPKCESTPCKCEMDERTIARREPPRKMTRPQIKGRDGIGKKILKNKGTVARLKKKHGADWKSYLWAIATNKAIAKHD